MWNTSQGDRMLQGAEAALFKAGVVSLVECVKEEAEYTTDGYSVVVFDQLTWSQRLAVLESISTYLLTNTSPAPKLSAVNEAAIAMVFEFISYQIDIEIDDEPPSNLWRSLVLDAANECFGDNSEEEEADDDFIPDSADSQRRDIWHPLVQTLADQILWDRDFEMIETFIDEPPEKATMMRQIMGIDDDYFSTAADDLHSPGEVAESLNRLSNLLSDASTG